MKSYPSTKGRKSQGFGKFYLYAFLGENCRQEHIHNGDDD